MNPRPNETCTCASACVGKLPRLCAVRLWDLWLSSHLCQWCMEKVCPGDRTASCPHRSPVPTLGRLLPCVGLQLTGVVSQQVLDSPGGVGGCWTAQVCRNECVSVCVCAKFSLKTSLEACWIVFRLSEIPFSYLWLRKSFGRSDISRVAPALGSSHVCNCGCTFFSDIFSHHFGSRCATSRFLKPFEFPRKLATSFSTWCLCLC